MYTHTLGKIHALLLLLFIYKYLSSSLLAFTFFRLGEKWLKAWRLGPRSERAIFQSFEGKFYAKSFTKRKQCFLLKDYRAFANIKVGDFPGKQNQRLVVKATTVFFCLLMFYPPSPALLQIQRTQFAKWIRNSAFFKHPFLPLNWIELFSFAIFPIIFKSQNNYTEANRHSEIIWFEFLFPLSIYFLLLLSIITNKTNKRIQCVRR